MNGWRVQGYGEKGRGVREFEERSAKTLSHFASLMAKRVVVVQGFQCVTSVVRVVPPRAPCQLRFQAGHYEARAGCAHQRECLREQSSI